MNDQNRKLIGKILIHGELECITGLHIGSSKETMEIGALDSPVVRDPMTRTPYIPGSSLKGKLRSLLEKSNPILLPNRNGGTAANPIMRHECEDWEKKPGQPGARNCSVCRLFGSTGPGERNQNYPARLKVRDLNLINRQELERIDTGLYLTEWKFENSIDRITSAANPRNIERVPKGAKFEFSFIYDVEDTETLRDDMENLWLAVRLLHDDALGGHGSRGYGRVALQFTSVEARTMDFYRGKENGTLLLKGLTPDEVDKIVQFFQDVEKGNA